jgi:hypothetical protein
MAMKKSVKILLIAILILPLILAIVSAAPAAGGLPNTIESTAQTAQNTIDTTTSTIKSIQSGDFLSQQWVKFLTQTTLGKEMAPFVDFPAKLNFIWKYLLGLEFTYSTLFFINLIIWILVASFTNRVVDFFAVFSWKARWAVVLVFMFCVSTIGIIRYFSSLIVSIINASDKWYVKILIWIVVLFGAFFIWKYSHLIKSLLNKIKDKIDKIKEKRKAKRELRDIREELNAVEEGRIKPKEKGKVYEEEEDEKIGKETLRQVGKIVREPLPSERGKFRESLPSEKKKK